MKTALLLGATGLTGGFVLTELINSGTYSTIIVPVRRQIKVDSPIVQVIVNDFKDISELKWRIKADDVYCCLGTTIAVAKSKEAFHHIDYDLPLEFARMAVDFGASTFSLMSSLGSDAKSWNFYLKTKGELENDLMILPFDRLNIYRPSMLLGPRTNTRSTEKAASAIMTGLGFMWQGPLKKYKPIESADVAKAIVHQGINRADAGLKIYESAEIQSIADNA